MSNRIKKRKAYQVYHKAQRDGLIPNVKTLVCEDCGNQAENYHHEDYDKPLDLTPLCEECHRRRHNPYMDRDVILTPEEAYISLLQRVKCPQGIKEWLNKGEYSEPETLQQKAVLEIARYGTIRALAEAIDVNPGLIHRAKVGGNSPTLRKVWNMPKYPYRPRLNIEVSPELKARFDAQRGTMSRSEYLKRLLELEVKA